MLVMDAAHRLAGMVAFRPLRRKLDRFLAQARRARATSRRLLADTLASSAASQFGRDHHLSNVRTVADFRRHVPIASYAYHAPYIERLKMGQRDSLFDPSQRVLMFALTSGTTAAPKYIPVTSRYVRAYREGWMLWGLKTLLDHPTLYHNTWDLRPKGMVQLVGNWDEFRTPTGTPCGSVSGLIARMQRPLVRSLYFVPPATGLIKDPVSKFYTVLRVTMPRRVGQVLSANPSTLIGLARTGDEHKQDLIRDIADGTLSDAYDVPGAVRRSLASELKKPNRRRARELDAIVARTGNLLPRDYWPTLGLLGNWTGGTVGAYIRQFSRLFGDVPVRDIGLMASESRMTIPLADGTPAGVLDVSHHFFEFVPEGERGSSRPIVLEAHELEPGRSYFILMTTASGLYRYDIHDVVRCTGFFGEAPVLEFLNKGSQFSNVTGEKLSEYQVVSAVHQAGRELQLDLGCFTVAPCWDDPPYYALLAEESEVPSPQAASGLAARVDTLLAHGNVEYRNKRDTRRLAPLAVRLVRSGTWDELQRRSSGAAEQYKHPYLVPSLDFARQFPDVRAASKAVA
jgi:hypothetical protein